jgi:hypothetical protein
VSSAANHSPIVQNRLREMKQNQDDDTYKSQRSTTDMLPALLNGEDSVVSAWRTDLGRVLSGIARIGVLPTILETARTERR